jgi:hypothetical protein
MSATQAAILDVMDILAETETLQAMFMLIAIMEK